MPRLMIVVASTRPGRVGLPVARWFLEQARKQPAFDIDFADLAQIDLPLMNEPHHPRLRRYTHRHTLEWSARVDAADAFVFVMPEYNYGYTAPLKNALDYLQQEWAHKPAGFVSYGGISGGIRALQLLKPVISSLKMVPLEAVSIPYVARLVTAEGEFRPDEAVDAAAAAMLAEVLRWHEVLLPLRAPKQV